MKTLRLYKLYKLFQLYPIIVMNSPTIYLGDYAEIKRLNDVVLSIDDGWHEYFYNYTLRKNKEIYIDINNKTSFGYKILKECVDHNYFYIRYIELKFIQGVYSIRRNKMQQFLCNSIIKKLIQAKKEMKLPITYKNITINNRYDIYDERQYFLIDMNVGNFIYHYEINKRSIKSNEYFNNQKILNWLLKTLDKIC